MINRNIVFIFIYFLVAPIIFNYIIIIGDQPDLYPRFRKLFLIFNQYQFFGYHIEILEQLKSYLYGRCVINDRPLLILPSNTHSECYPDITYTLYSYSYFLITIFPLFISLLIFLRLFHQDYKSKINELSLILIFPSVIFYINLFSIESIVLLFSIFAVLFRGKVIVPLLLSVICIFLDVGNGLIVLLYLIGYLFFKLFPKFILSSMFIIFLLSATGFILEILLDPLSSIFFKFQSIQSSYSSDDVINKYPIILRPVITYMSFLFYTPMNYKALALYVYFTIFLLFFIRRVINLRFKVDIKFETIESLYTLLFICIIVMTFPTYANAKYYIFLLVVFMSLFLRVYKFNMLLCIFTIGHVIALTNLLVYRTYVS